MRGCAHEQAAGSLHVRLASSLGVWKPRTSVFFAVVKIVLASCALTASLVNDILAYLAACLAHATICTAVSAPLAVPKTCVYIAAVIKNERDKNDSMASAELMRPRKLLMPRTPAHSVFETLGPPTCPRRSGSLPKMIC
jgi:hypothetical protein